MVFLQYWSNWIIVHSLYKVQKYFITSNSFKCFAHISLMTARDNFEVCLSPWILGFQSCEQTFRSVKSMSGIFSTYINFDVLRLLRQLHCLDIIPSLQTQFGEIKYQQSNDTISEVRTPSFQGFTNDRIDEEGAKVSLKT